MNGKAKVVFGKVCAQLPDKESVSVTEGFSRHYLSGVVEYRYTIHADNIFGSSTSSYEDVLGYWEKKRDEAREERIAKARKELSILIPDDAA